MKKKLLIVLMAMAALAIFSSQAVADQIMVTGGKPFASEVYHGIKAYFPNAPLQFQPTNNVYDVPAVLFLDDSNNVYSVYRVEISQSVSAGQKIPPAVLSSVKVFMGSEPVMEFRDEVTASQEMANRHSSGLDVHKYVPKYSPYLEVADRYDGYVYIKMWVASDDKIDCWLVRKKIPIENFLAHIPPGFTRIYFPGDGSIQAVDTIGIWVAPTGWGGY